METAASTPNSERFNESRWCEALLANIALLDSTASKDRSTVCDMMNIGTHDRDAFLYSVLLTIADSRRPGKTW